MNIPAKICAAVFTTLVLLACASRAEAFKIYAVDSSNKLLSFDSATPGIIQATTQITGLQSGESIRGIDFRPASTQLYALGSTNRLYTINTATGAATPVGAPGAFTLNGTIFGFDIDPVADRIRVVSNLEQNILLHPFDGTLVATDGALAYGPGDPNAAANPNITAAAYTNSFPAAPSTALYDIDGTLDIVATQNPPEAGTLGTVGALGVNTASVVGFDIAFTSGNNIGYATMRVGGTIGLYTIELSNGAATLVGAIAGDPDLVDMTVSLEPQTFVVTNTSHLAFGVCGASCNLRQAIEAANRKPGGDLIEFNIPGSGVHTFNVFSGGLPVIVDRVTIDGYSQPGASPNTLAVGNNADLRIELNGASAGNAEGGLVIQAPLCTVKGLVINRFTNAGIVLKNPGPFEGGHIRNTVTGNFIGTDPTGSVALGNGTGVLVSGPNCQIGDGSANRRNLISGNNGHGIRLNNAFQSFLNSSIRNNYIGTDKNGAAALGNGLNGIFVGDGGNQIGGPPGYANVISGNGENGIEIQGATAPNNRVQGNLIGVNATGDADLGNAKDGVRISGAPSNLVGGGTPSARNVISGNNDSGVYILFAGATNNRVLGNFIGTDVTGQADLGNGNGVAINGPANFIGGTVPGEGNLISGNAFYGVVLNDTSTTDNRVEGNRIGTDAAGGPLGNQYGVYFVHSASNTTVGGPGGAANTIAFNSNSGVFLNSTAGTGNDITGNSIFSNGGLGIDLLGVNEGFGVTPNDSLDQDSGPNNLQNRPVLTGITGSGDSAAVEGQLHSSANTAYVIDFYGNNAVDPSGFGEGQNPLGFLNVQTDPQGNATFSFPLGSNAAGQFITATATDPAGNTSEFSQASAVVPGPPPPTPTPTATPTPLPARLANISTRLRVETGDNVLIGGFIVTGTQPKKIIVRAIGPSLPFGDRLADPTLELHGPSGLIEANDNWVQSPNKQAIIASTIPPSNDRESAIVATVPANNSAYTAIVRGVNGGTGLGIVEAYDLDSAADSKLANISTRGLVQTGDNVLIAGTIIVGEAAQKIIVRAIGPSLSISGKLEDPTLELRGQNGDLVASNDDWRSTQEGEIIATTIPPPSDFESAIVTTLTANGASYTAIVRGVNNTPGIAVVEVYALQ